jgi:uncharacterized protein YcbK (DUF882 family)
MILWRESTNFGAAHGIVSLWRNAEARRPSSRRIGENPRKRPNSFQKGFRELLTGLGLCHKVACSGDAATKNGRVSWPKLKMGQAETTMTKSMTAGMTRRGLLGAFAATAVAATPTYSNAFGFLRGAGDIRRIRMYSGRTGESLDTIYWIEGDYIDEALREISLFMRDWRNGKSMQIDSRTVDIMAASHRLLDANEPYMMLSGYRSPETNAMLRSRSRGVARNSLHMKGQAADLRLSSRSVTQMARAASACSAGGVGKYSRSNFVHMDCGPVRTWGG